MIAPLEIHAPQGEFRKSTVNRIALSGVLRSTEVRTLRRRRSRRWIKAAIGLASVAALGLVSQSGMLRGSAAAVPTDEHTVKVQQVQVVHPAPPTSSDVSLPATIRPWQGATLYARVSGYLAAWHQDLGASVRAGDLLAEIDTPELDRELATARALAIEAQASADHARAERIEAESDLVSAEAQVDRVRSELALVRSQLARREQLLASKTISQEDYDTFQRTTEARTADLAAAVAAVSRYRSNLETRTALIAVRAATLESRKANVERLEELQRFKKIVAPFDGTVTRRSAEIGALITPGQDALFVIEDVSRLRVQVNVPQSEALRIRVGVPAIITVPEVSGRIVESSVTRMAQSVDAASRTMLTEIELENSKEELLPGSYVRVTLAVPHENPVWTIPTNTVSMRVDGAYIALVTDNEFVELRRVTLGRDFGKSIEIVNGVEGKERLIVNPGDGLRNGTAVEVRNEQKVAAAK